MGRAEGSQSQSRRGSPLTTPGSVIRFGSMTCVWQATQSATPSRDAKCQNPKIQYSSESWRWSPRLAYHIPRLRDHQGRLLPRHALLDWHPFRQRSTMAARSGSGCSEKDPQIAFDESFLDANEHQTSQSAYASTLPGTNNSSFDACGYSFRRR